MAPKQAVKVAMIKTPTDAASKAVAAGTATPKPGDSLAADQIKVVAQALKKIRSRADVSRRVALMVALVPEATHVKCERAEKYRLIHDALQQIHDLALILADSPLAESLKRLQDCVRGKCHDKKPKPQ